MDILISFNQNDKIVKTFLVGKLKDELFTGICYANNKKSFIFKNLIIPNEDSDGNIIDDETMLSTLLKDGNFVIDCYETLISFVTLKSGKYLLRDKYFDKTIFTPNVENITNNTELMNIDLTFTPMLYSELKWYSGLVNAIDECFNNIKNIDVLDGYSFNRNDIALALQACYLPNGEQDIEDIITLLPLDDIENDIALGDLNVSAIISHI